MIPKSAYRFSERSCSNKKLKRNHDSTQSYFALAASQRVRPEEGTPHRAGAMGTPGRPDDKLREFRRRTLSGASVPLRSLHPKQFDVEDQRGIRWNDAAGTACAIAEFGRN